MSSQSLDDTRQRILNRLERALGPTQHTAAEQAVYPAIPSWSVEAKIDRLQANMEAIRSEVYRVSESNWVNRLIEIAQAKKINNLLYGPDSPLASVIEDAKEQLPELIPYSADIEEFKQTLFEVDAGITSTLGGIADTGAIALWPTLAEPRTLSLVPHTHFAVVEAKNIYASMSEIMIQQNWAVKMPTNALFISGPSKTADIEFTLAFGVHGPKELVVLIVES